MAAPRLGHAGEAVEPIADHGTAGRQGFLGELLDLLATEAFDPAQLDPDGLALVGGLYRGDEWCFPHRISTTACRQSSSVPYLARNAASLSPF